MSRTSAASVPRRGHIQSIVHKVVLERKHKALMAQFRAIDSGVMAMPASAVYFEPPTQPDLTVMTKLKDRGFACKHGRFRFETCRRCGRSTQHAQAELMKIQRMYE